MIETDAHREILEDDYRRHRERADTHREREEYRQAAKHYAKCAAIKEEIADLVSSDRLAEKHRALAKNLRAGADRLAAGRPLVDETVNADGGPAAGNVEEPSQTTRRSAAEPAEAAAYLEAPPELTFEDVGGMTELKQTLIDKVVDPLERAELYDKYDLGVVNGVFLYGPPGTGKTYITRALAGKLGYHFIEITASDITSSLVGEAAQNVADVFEVARDNQPCIVFIDEIDGIAAARSSGGRQTPSEQQMVNQLLTELNEVQGEDVIVVAATNRPEAIDEAVTRSGRFDERIEVPPPDAEARIAILRVHLRERPVLTDEIDWDALKSLTEGYTASDMALIAKEAARQALKEATEDNLQYITQAHLEAAIDDTEPSLGG